MFEKFTTKELITCALFGAIIFLVLFILGTALIAITGIPASGGILSMLISVLIATIGVRIINKFGTATIIFAITGTLAIPTLIFGPPGVYKIFLLLMTGLIYDLIVIVLKRNKTSYIITGTIVGMCAPLLIYISLILIGLPGPEKLKPMLAIFSVVYAVLGAIGAYLGIWIFENKLKNKAFVRQLQV